MKNTDIGEKPEVWETNGNRLDNQAKNTSVQ